MTLLIRPLSTDFSFSQSDNPLSMAAYCAFTISEERQFSQLQPCSAQQVRWDEELRFQLHSLEENLWVELWIKHNGMDRKVGEGNIDLRRHYNQADLAQNQRMDLRENDRYAGKLSVTIQYKASNHSIEEIRKKRKASLPPSRSSPIIDFQTVAPTKNVPVIGPVYNPIKNQLEQPAKNNTGSLVEDINSRNLTYSMNVNGDRLRTYHDERVNRQEEPKLAESVDVVGRARSGITVSTYKVFDPTSNEYNNGPISHPVTRQEVTSQISKAEPVLNKPEQHIQLQPQPSQKQLIQQQLLQQQQFQQQQQQQQQQFQQQQNLSHPQLQQKPKEPSPVSPPVSLIEQQHLQQQSNQRTSSQLHPSQLNPSYPNYMTFGYANIPQFTLQQPQRIQKPPTQTPYTNNAHR